ncbi:hypothetical protein ACLOJK_033846 [Asimina triloba]
MFISERWRTKGTLTNYTPLHARADLIDSRDYKVNKVKSITIKIKEPKLQKRKHFEDNAEIDGESVNSDQNFQKRKVFDEETSNRSSSGSAISYSESCGQFGSTDASDLTGTAQSTVFDSLVPSRKRTCIGRPKPSPVEKLTKDLCCILHEQQSSYLSGSSEEDLLLETGTPMEIGHGGILIKHPSSATKEEESEASSLPIDSKRYTASYSYLGSSSLPVHIESKGMGIPNNVSGKVKKITGQGALDNIKRDKPTHDKFHLLLNSNSPLKSINLRNVASYENFMGNLTNEEQGQLMKYLPPPDTDGVPHSLKSMFDSPQFLEMLSSFQQLLLEGAFDLSFPGINADECRTLKKLALVNLSKSKWIEHYKLLKDTKFKQMIGGKEVGASCDGLGEMASVKRPFHGQNQNFSAKSPNRVHKAVHDIKDVDNDGSCFSPRSLFALPTDQSSMMLDPLQFSDDSSDQDLLLDVPSYACFPQAELLDCHLLQRIPSTNSKSENRDVRKEDSLLNHPSSTFNSQQLSSSSSVVHPRLILR